MQNALRFLMKKKVLPLWQITFDPLKNRLKNIYQWSKTCVFFHQKSEGIAFTFCRYLNQNMRAFIFCRYCPQIVFCPQIWKTKKSSKIEGNTLGILRRSFFPFNALGMPSFNNSVPRYNNAIINCGEIVKTLLDHTSVN